MKLELGIIKICDIRFGEQSKIEGSTLYVNKDELKALILEDETLASCELDIRPLQSLSWLFPLRHYYMIYQTCVFNGFPLIESWFHFAALAGFMLLPWLVVKKIKNAMLTYVYIP